MSNGWSHRVGVVDIKHGYKDRVFNTLFWDGWVLERPEQ